MKDYFEETKKMFERRVENGDSEFVEVHGLYDFKFEHNGMHLTVRCYHGDGKLVFWNDNPAPYKGMEFDSYGELFYFLDM